MLLVPRVDVVRKCLFICSEQEQANKTTRRPTLTVFVAEGEESRPSDLRRGSMKHSCSQATHTELQSHGLEAVKKQLASLGNIDLMDVTHEVLTLMQACAQCVHA